MTRIFAVCILFTMSPSFCGTKLFCVFGCTEIHFNKHKTEANKEVHDTYIYAELMDVSIIKMPNSIYLHIYIEWMSST